MLDDDGCSWPTSVARIDLKYPKDWGKKGEALSSIAMIHEAGAMAVAKRHGRGPCLIIRTGSLPGDNKTRRLLDTPRVWGAIEALAQYIEDSGDGGGCYGAMGTEAGRLEDSNALRLIVDKLIEDVEPTPGVLQ